MIDAADATTLQQELASHCWLLRNDVADFRILGPLELLVGPKRLELNGTRQQIVLAMLLLNANGVVSVGRLEEAIYDGDPPPT